jgi:hypothetical protein
MRLPRFTKSLLAAAFLVAFAGLAHTSAFGQTCSANNTAIVDRGGWSRGSTVNVFIDTNNMSADAQQAVRDAFANWQAAGSQNGSNVTFNFTTTRPTSGVGTWVTVSTATNITDPATGGRVRAQTNNTNDTNTGEELRAGIRFDDVMTNYAAVLESMVHEIGHTFGFNHCDTCGITESVMARTPYDPNDPSTYNVAYGKPTSPTDCDNYKLHAMNYPDCGADTSYFCSQNGGSWNGLTCTCDYGGGGGGGGGGYGGGGSYGEGGGGYCTPYYWVWYESYDGGKTWEPTGEVEYAGCW